MKFVGIIFERLSKVFGEGRIMEFAIDVEESFELILQVSSFEDRQDVTEIFFGEWVPGIFRDNCEIIVGQNLWESGNGGFPELGEILGVAVLDKEVSLIRMFFKSECRDQLEEGFLKYGSEWLETAEPAFWISK